MSQDEDRRVERRVRTPPPFPLRVLMPSGVAELPGTHELGPYPWIVQPHEGIVDAAGPSWLGDHLVPPPGREHPFVQSVAGMAERRFEALRFAGAEPVERDR